MAEITLVTGGSRSGKSGYAQKRAEALQGPRAYLATCPILDEEMAERCRKHQAARSAADWETIEEETDIAGVLRNDRRHAVILVDCLTLWVNNQMYRAEQEGKLLTEDDIASECRRLLDACQVHAGQIIFVTNEVGMGIVPDNPAGRRFRDLAGRCNQMVATGADNVIFMVSGISWPVKQREGK